MSYNMLQFKDETDIQNMMNDFLQKEKFGPILNESYIDRFPELQKHQYILIDDFVKYITILNSDLWSNGVYQENKEKIIQIIKEDFIKKFNDAKNNQSIYNIIFGRDSRCITLTKLDGKDDNMVNYRVIDTDYKTDCRNNEIKIIREKVIKIHMALDETQRPDFAVYLNGIPFIAIEVKNPVSTVGIYEAFKDYKQKTTYHKFLTCLCTDGINAALSSNHNALTIDDWKNYGKHKSIRFQEENNGFFDFAEEFLFNVKNFVFYFQYGVFKTPIGLGNLRVQQYYVMKEVFKLLDTLPKDTIFREVVKQPPRSGKTIAIRSVINNITMLYPESYQKIFIQVPDLTIMGQFFEDFKAFTFGHGFKVKLINRRKKDASDKYSNDYSSYEEAVEDSNKCIYIMNMQKISEEMSELKDPGKNVLIFIDEVHTHQLGENSTIRDVNFENASYITFTATTRKSEGKNGLIDETLQRYSTSGKYLDELFNEDAKNLGMVVPVVYEKARYDAVLNKENAAIFSELVETQIKEKILNEPKYAGVLKEVEEKTIDYTKDLIQKEYGDVFIDIDDLFRNRKNLEIINKSMTYKEKLINQKTNGVINKIKAEALRQIKSQLIPDTINYITLDLKNKIEENYSKLDIETGIITPYFKAKVFLLVDDQKMANRVGKHIKEVSGGTNIINGFRFGMDYSETSKENDSNLSFINEFNIIKNGNTIKDDFDSQEDNSVDILIIVGKYLMGYDNKRLVAVYCNTNIAEPSRIFQLYTRSATKLENKNIGFFVDLCFDNQNYDTYKRALAWYETGSESSVLFLEEDQIEIQRERLNQYIVDIAKILKIEKIDLLKRDKERNLFTFGLTLEEQNKILNLCKGVHITIRNLVSPKYYKDYLAYVLTINKALWGLLNHLKANKKEPIFTNKDIEILFFDFLKTLKLNISEIMEIDLLDGKFIKQIDAVPAKETIISKQLYQVKSLLDANKDYMHTDIFSKLRMVAEDIEASNKWDDSIAETTKKLLDDSQKETSKIKNGIKNNFNNQSEWFITFNVMRNYLSSLNLDVNENDVNFKSFTEDVSNIIKELINANTRTGILIKTDKLIESIRQSFSDILPKFLDKDQELFVSIYQNIAADNVKEQGTFLSNILIEQVQIKKNEFK